MNRLTTLPVAAIVLVGTLVAWVQPAAGARLSPVLQLSPRAEVRHDLDAPDPDYPLIFISRFGAASKVGPWQARAVGQSWGRYRHGRTLELYEGWLQHAGERWSIRAGRQVIHWHEGRIMFHRRWRPRGVVHDAVRLLAKGDNWVVDASAGKPFDEERPFAALRAGLRWGDEQPGAAKGPSGGLIDAMYIRDGVSWTDRARHTFGLWARHREGAHTIRAEGYGQIGQLANGTDVTAWLASLKLTTRVQNWRLSLYGDALSGDAPGSAKGSGSFFILHGARHGFYGIIDEAVLRRGGAVDGRGLTSGGILGDWRDGPWRLLVHLCHLRYANLDEFGTELDLLVRYKASKRASVVLGGAMLTDPPTDPKVFGYVAFLFNLGK